MELNFCFKQYKRRRICSLTFYFYSVYLINLPLLTKSQTCNNGLDLCQSLSDCQAYAEMTSPNYKSFKWCDISNNIVCCPQVRFNNPSIFGIRAEIEKPYDRDCKKWQESVYPRCPSEGLISQGTGAQAGEFPHLALIGRYENSKYDWYCGGSLISPRFVVTAAHCLFDRADGELPNRVRLGEINYASSNDNRRIQEFQIENATKYVHPEYKFSETYWDIALLELKGLADLNEYVLPICLPHTNGSEQDRFYAAGWGLLGPAKLKATHLQKVTLERFEDQDCIKRTGIDPFERPDGVRISHQICAGSYVDKRDTCPGDSGGPLFIEHHVRPCMFELHGITSFGAAGCGTKGSPGVYTRLLPYIDWIESIVWPNKN